MIYLVPIMINWFNGTGPKGQFLVNGTSPKGDLGLDIWTQKMAGTSPIWEKSDNWD